MKIDTKQFRVRPARRSTSENGRRRKPICDSKEDYKKSATGITLSVSALQHLSTRPIAMPAAGLSGDGCRGEGRRDPPLMSDQSGRLRCSSFKQPALPSCSTIFCGAPRNGCRSAAASASSTVVLRGGARRPRASRTAAQRGPRRRTARRQGPLKQRYRSIVEMENHLHRNGTRIVKIFLHLSAEEQRKRFLAPSTSQGRTGSLARDIHGASSGSNTWSFEECCARPARAMRPGSPCPQTTGHRAAHRLADRPRCARQPQDVLSRPPQSAS